MNMEITEVTHIKDGDPTCGCCGYGYITKVKFASQDKKKLRVMRRRIQARIANYGVFITKDGCIQMRGQYDKSALEKFCEPLTTEHGTVLSLLCGMECDSQ